MSKIHCYHVPPIDFWSGVLTEQEWLAKLALAFEDSDPDPEHAWRLIANSVRVVQQLVFAARKAFLEIGWEGDAVQGPYFFAVPGEGSMRLGYVLKQSNNGNCFVASPVPLPHLDNLAFEQCEKTVPEPF